MIIEQIAANAALEVYHRATILNRHTGIEAIAEQKCGCSGQRTAGFKIPLAYRSNFLVIAFRGTTNWIDWVRNFRLNRLVYPWSKDYQGEVRIHEGIAEGYKSVREQIHKYVKSCNCPILVTGHSQGGMTATIAAVDIQYHHSDRRVICITFGSPAVGNKAFKNSARNRIEYTGYRNSLDFIPYLLPQNCHIDTPITNNKLFIFPHSMNSYQLSVISYQKAKSFFQ